MIFYHILYVDLGAGESYQVMEDYVSQKELGGLYYITGCVGVYGNINNDYSVHESGRHVFSCMQSPWLRIPSGVVVMVIGAINHQEHGGCPKPLHTQVLWLDKIICLDSGIIFEKVIPGFNEPRRTRIKHPKDLLKRDKR